MKKISARLYFSVLGRGMYQVAQWVVNLFWNKKNGIIAKFMWAILGTSAAVVMALLAIAFIVSLCDTYYGKYYKEAHCYDPDCIHSEFLGKNIYYHNIDDGRGYVFNSKTEEKILRHVTWISKPKDNDSLICFCDGKKRGYFSKNSGKVVIPAKYNHAWVFSDGLASVDDNGTINFIDGTGQVVIDNVAPYVPKMDGLFFYGGYCVVDDNCGEITNLIDKNGKIVLPQEYSSIQSVPDCGLWIVRKGKLQGVYDKDFRVLIPLSDCSVWVQEGTIRQTLPNHTVRNYSLSGELMSDFYVAHVRMLEYAKDEILYRRVQAEEFDDNDKLVNIPQYETYHPTATARLRAYVAGDLYEGLMTADGHVVTMPLYKDIEAIGPDLYLCETTNDDRLILNGKGEIVK